MQYGDKPANSEQMKGKLRDVWAIKVTNDDGAAYRTTYVTVLGDDVYVLDTFKKKSTQGIATSQKDLDRIENRLKRAREIHEQKD